MEKRRGVRTTFVMLIMRIGGTRLDWTSWGADLVYLVAAESYLTKLQVVSLSLLEPKLLRLEPLLGSHGAQFSSSVSCISHSTMYPSSTEAE